MTSLEQRVRQQFCTWAAGCTDASVFLYAFDLIEFDSDDLRGEPLAVRKATCASLLSDTSPGLRFNEHIDHGNGPLVFAQACKLGLEGIVSKRRTGGYAMYQMLRLIIAAIAIAFVGLPASVSAQIVATQIRLTEKQVEGFIAAQKGISAVVEKMQSTAFSDEANAKYRLSLTRSPRGRDSRPNAPELNSFAGYLPPRNCHPVPMYQQAIQEARREYKRLCGCRGGRSSFREAREFADMWETGLFGPFG